MNSILSALVNGAIVSLLLAAAVWCALALIPRRTLGAGARYAVWWTALLATLFLPLAYLRLPRSTQAPIAHTATAPLLIHAASPLAGPAPRSTVALPHRASAPAALKRFPLVFAAGNWPRWLLLAWATASGLMFLRLAASCALLESRKRNAVDAPGEFAAQIQSWLSRPGRGSRGVKVKCPAGFGSPVLAGLWRPAILIPAALFTELTEQELEQIGLHEAAHLARRDDWALLAQRALESAMPLHPVVRWIARQLDLEREIACDDLVVDTTGVPRKYAACLTRVVELCGGVRASWAATGVAGEGSQLSRRVDRLLDRNRGTGARPGKARLAAAIGAVAIFALLAGRAPGAIALLAPPASAENALDIAPIPPIEVAEAPAPAPVPSPAPAQVATPLPQAQTPAPSPAYDLVAVPVTITDANGRHVTGLNREDFQILEDGVEQQIAEFSVQNPPYSIGIVLDVSGSMRDKQELVDIAVTGLLKTASTLNEFFLVTVNNDVHVTGGFIGDTSSLQQQLHLQQPRGGTALRDGILQAIQWKNATNPRKRLVVISDGDDNSSTVGKNELTAALQTSKTQISAITLLTAEEQLSRRRTAWLHDLTEENNGHEFIVDGPAQVAEAAGGIGPVNQYLLQYRSTNTALDGRFRQLQVRLKPSAGTGLTVRTRSGYYATRRW